MREKIRLSKMKWLALAALLAAVVGAGATAKWSGVGAAAEKYPGPTECNKEYSDRTLAGCFGWQSTAFVGTTTTNATAAIGLMHLDGAGNLTGWYSGSDSGVPIVCNYTGSYVVNPNGTGHLRFIDSNPPWNPGGLCAAGHAFDFVIVNGGNQVLMSSILNNTVQNVEMKRQ